MKSVFRSVLAILTAFVIVVVAGTVAALLLIAFVRVLCWGLSLEFDEGVRGATAFLAAVGTFFAGAFTISALVEGLFETLHDAIQAAQFPRLFPRSTLPTREGP